MIEPFPQRLSTGAESLSSNFSRLEVFTAKNFVDAETCNRLRTEAKQLESVPAQVTKSTGRVDIDMRRTSRLIVSRETQETIDAYCFLLQPQLETFYEIGLSGFEKFQFLKYQTGDFYKRHADGNDKVDSPRYIQARRVSVVIFLNGEGLGQHEDSYTGGTLVIWTWRDSQRVTVRIRGEIGKVIAFPSKLMHEVEMIESGERYSIVNWFF